MDKYFSAFPVSKMGRGNAMSTHYPEGEDAAQNRPSAYIRTVREGAAFDQHLIVFRSLIKTVIAIRMAKVQAHLVLAA